MRIHRLVLPALLTAVLGLSAVVHASVSSASSASTSRPALPVTSAPSVAIDVALKATKYEYTPNKVEVAVGTTIKFVITAVDLDHGFEIEGVKDSCVKIKKGESATVEYKAAKAGTIKFKCCDRCGLGHGKMSGTIVIK